MIHPKGPVIAWELLTKPRLGPFRPGSTAGTHFRRGREATIYGFALKRLVVAVLPFSFRPELLTLHFECFIKAGHLQKGKLI